MEERSQKQTNTNNILLLTIGIIALVIVCIGGTYAYFTATAKSGVQTVTTGTLTTTYTKGADIAATNLTPTTEENAELHTFTVKNTGTKDATLKLTLVETSLTKGATATTSANLKYALYEADSSSYTSKGTAIATGTFATTPASIVLKDSISIASQGSKYYILKIWLNETGAEQNADQGLSFSTKVQAEMK